MRKTQIVLAFLAAALGACSGGEGSGAPASSNQPPPPPPAPPAEPPQTPPLPPVETLACSPCNKIVFMSRRDGNYEIYSVAVDGTELTRLTNSDSYDGEPAWSPDGTRIAFTSERDFEGSGDPVMTRDLYVMDADGTNVERLTFSKSGAWRPAWSPDGTRIAYGSFSDGSLNLWEIAAEGGTPRLLFSSPGVDVQPAWSPDGTRLALVSDWFAYDIKYDVFVINADGSGFTAVTDGNIFDNLDYEDPAWSPDGGRVAMTVRRNDYDTRLGVASASGLNIKLLPTRNGATVGTPTWSSDGTMIAYTSCIDDRCQVSWIRADGTARGEIVADGSDPDWQR